MNMKHKEAWGSMFNQLGSWEGGVVWIATMETSKTVWVTTDIAQISNPAELIVYINSNYRNFWNLEWKQIIDKKVLGVLRIILITNECFESLSKNEDNKNYLFSTLIEIWEYEVIVELMDKQWGILDDECKWKLLEKYAFLNFKASLKEDLWKTNPDRIEQIMYWINK